MRLANRRVSKFTSLRKTKANNNNRVGCEARIEISLLSLALRPCSRHRRLRQLDLACCVRWPPNDLICWQPQREQQCKSLASQRPARLGGESCGRRSRWVIGGRRQLKFARLRHRALRGLRHRSRLARHRAGSPLGQSGGS